MALAAPELAAPVKRHTRVILTMMIMELVIIIITAIVIISHTMKDKGAFVLWQKQVWRKQ